MLTQLPQAKGCQDSPMGSKKLSRYSNFGRNGISVLLLAIGTFLILLLSPASWCWCRWCSSLKPSGLDLGCWHEPPSVLWILWVLRKCQLNALQTWVNGWMDVSLTVNNSWWFLNIWVSYPSSLPSLSHLGRDKLPSCEHVCKFACYLWLATKSLNSPPKSPE